MLTRLFRHDTNHIWENTLDMKDEKGKDCDRYDIIRMLKDSAYYNRRREAALKGEKIEEFVEEMESLLDNLWRTLYDATMDMEKLKQNLSATEDKSTKLQDILIQQLFDSVTDGVTN